MTKIIQEAIKTIIAIFVPGAGIVKAIIAIYDTVVFFIQKAKQIAEMVGNFLGSIAEIAAGNIQAGADALENGLATALKLVINFLARFLHLDAITAKIRNAIQKIRDKVDTALDRVVEWVVDKGKGLFAKLPGRRDGRKRREGRLAGVAGQIGKTVARTAEAELKAVDRPAGRKRCDHDGERRQACRWAARRLRGRSGEPSGRHSAESLFVIAQARRRWPPSSSAAAKAARAASVSATRSRLAEEKRVERSETRSRLFSHAIEEALGHSLIR